MKLYDCKVRLHGDVRDEVRKKNVTSGEIRVLQSIHGDDAVAEITPNGALAHSEVPEQINELRDDAEERDRLSRLYGEIIVAKLFGAPKVTIGAEIADDVFDTPRVPTARRGPRAQKTTIDELIA